MTGTTFIYSMVDVCANIENDRITSGKVITMIEGQEWMRFELGSDYLYMKGPKGAISTTVRETWSGKIRYELFVENANGQEAAIILDFYQEDDSLVGELKTSESDQSVMFKLSRIDKVSIEDLSVSENINEITVDMINAGLASLLKLMANIESPASAGTTEEAAAMTENGNAEVEEIHVTLPEDNGMAGVYKWIEMENYGLDTYLILWDDGIGSTDIVGTGTVRGVFYDDETMQVADEGTVPQKYAYADGKLTWSYTDESGAHISTFVKLTADERAAYEALGVGTVVNH